MSPNLSALLAAWVASEPIASSVMFIAAILLFWTSFARIWSETPVLYKRIERVFRLLASVALFLGLLWSFYFFISRNNTAFNQVLTKLIAANPTTVALQDASARWGGGVVQRELMVQHYVEQEVVDEIRQGQDKDGKDKPTLYIKRKTENLITQESLMGFTGEIHLKVVDPTLTKFELQADYLYTVINQSEFSTIARFVFPLASMRLYEGLSVQMDDRLVNWNIESDVLGWEQKMAPGQRSMVRISYRTRGIDLYQYRIENQRVIQKFSLTVIADAPNLEQIRYSIQPASKAIQFTEQDMPASSYQLHWAIDQVIIAPTVTVQVAMPPVNTLSTQILSVLNYTGRALVMLLSLITLTLILFSLRVDLLKLVLLTLVFLAQFLAVCAIYPFVERFGIATILFGFGTLLICFFIFRDTKPLPRNLILALTLIFAILYPFAGLLPGTREKIALDGAIQAAMILYLFVLTFYIRVRYAKKVSAEQE